MSRDINKKHAHDRRRHKERMIVDLDYRLRKILNTIRHRCDTTKHNSSKYYHGKGIKNFLVLDDLVYLWERDRAYHYKRPSIDRIDCDGHYERSNCRFIELSLNCHLAAERTAAIRAGMVAAALHHEHAQGAA